MCWGGNESWCVDSTALILETEALNCVGGLKGSKGTLGLCLRSKVTFPQDFLKGTTLLVPRLPLSSPASSCRPEVEPELAARGPVTA